MRHALSILAISLFILSCEGPAGPPGEQGPQGPQGEPGDEGVANIYTRTFSIDSDQTVIEGGVGLNGISVSQITQEVFNNGTVKVEYQAADGVWFGLPWTFGNDFSDDLDVDETIELNYGYEEGALYIAHMSSYSLLLRSDIREGPYKLVVIPPSENSTSAKLKSGNIIQGAALEHFKRKKN